MVKDTANTVRKLYCRVLCIEVTAISGHILASSNSSATLTLRALAIHPNFASTGSTLINLSALTVAQSEHEI